MTTEQRPIPSGHGPRTTADELLGDRDLSGMTAVVTGGYSGLGLETTRVLTERGMRVVIPARDPLKAKRSTEKLKGVELHQLDLLDPASIDAFSDKLLRSGRQIDVLINSAGIMAPPLSRDARGHESQFSANHLGHFQLTARLWPLLKKAGKARVVALSSGGHRFSRVDFRDPDFRQRPYEKWVAYGQSKTANALFAVALDKRGAAHGIRAFSVHPGAILTDLSRHLTSDDLAAFGVQRRGNGTMVVNEEAKGFFKTVGEGAATTIWCGFDVQLEGKGGVYCEDCDIAQAVPCEDKGFGGVCPWAIDAGAAERLWKLSEKMTGVMFQG
ncbi:SDR family NAD(P)-dependent oxidoreductase [Rhizobium sp. RAF36]|uniref:SDR family NAD(P)-dependent oxidoreductase n=1 Tax=Rhizobium sp. RAF36 TaxID=3233055 RepID=UPI003F9EA1D2